MSKRKALVAAPEESETHDGSAEFEVEAHGAQSQHAEEPEQPAGGESPNDAPEPVPAIMGWTPEEATQLICAIWNFGMLVYGPEWAADPRETLGWNFHAAQLLDHVLPKGTGGYVELGTGLIMVGNGLAMMGVRRIDIIRSGPKPMWGAKPKATQEPGTSPPGPVPAPSSSSANGTGHYKMPRDLAPTDTDPLKGIGL